MNIFISGINYKTASLEIREKLSFNADELKCAVREIYNLSEVTECVILSTCNRTEVYIYSDNKNFKFDIVEKLLCSLKSIDIYNFKKHFFFYEGQKAVKHLFKVSCGLDSLIFGEDQILGQVKSAHELALSMETTSTVLNTLFREVITAAKRVKKSTDISKKSVSAASIAVKLLDDVFKGQLENKSVLLIGMGKIGSITLKNLIDRGVQKIYITNRTHSKLDRVLNDNCNIKDNSNIKDNISIVHVNYIDRYSVINEVDIVISSTSSPHYTITRDMLEEKIIDLKKRVFIDLAVPRDIDDSIKEMCETWYYNIDDIKVAVEKGFEERHKESIKAEDILDEYVCCYEKWYKFREILPVIMEIQKNTDDLLNEKVTQTLLKLKSTSEEDKEIIKTSMKNIANSILEKFMYKVRDDSSIEDMVIYFRCLSATIDDDL